MRRRSREQSDRKGLTITERGRAPRGGFALVAGWAIALPLVTTVPVLAASPEAQSPETRAVELTLEQAITQATERFQGLRIAEARRDAATAGVEAAQAGWLPRIEAGASFLRTDDPVGVFGGLLRQGAFTEGNFALDALNEPDPLEDWGASLELRQPLWTAGRLRSARLGAEAVSEAAAADLEATRQSLVRDVVAAYSGAVVASRRIAVVEAGLRTAEAHAALAADLVDAGLAVESDQLQAEVRVSEIREELIRATSDRDLSQAGLNLLLGNPLDQTLRLPEDMADPLGDLEASSAVAGGEDGELAALLARAEDARPDLRAAEARSRAARESAAGARAIGRPELGLTARLEAHADGGFDETGANKTLAFGIRIPLFEGARRQSRLAAAEAAAEAAQAASDLEARQVALEVHRAFLDRRSARQRIEPAHRAVGLAERSLAIVEDRYREGLTTLAELLDAQAALTGARLRLLGARQALLVATANLELAVGDL